MEAPKQFTAVLKGGGMPTPQLFTSMRKIGVIRDGKVAFASQEFMPEGDALPDGTEVIVHLVNGPGATRISFESKAERDTYEEWREREWARRRQAEEAERERLAEERRLRQEAVVSDLKERVPFNWTSGIKVVYSGVLEHSSLTGMNRRSVTHIATLDDIACGRLKRKAEQFLCDTDNGKMFAHLDRDGDPLCPTCPKCLEIVERLIRHPKLTIAPKDDAPSAPGP